MQSATKVMVFGFFDGLHEDHETFLQTAKVFGDRMLAVVLQDHIARELKRAFPAKNFVERFEDLKDHDRIDEVLIGDPEFGVRGPIRKYAPDVVVFGSGQHALRRNFDKNAHLFKKLPIIRTVHTKLAHL